MSHILLGRNQPPPYPGFGGAARALERLLAGTGVRFDGPRPWDIQVHHAGFFRRVLAHGSMGFGEAYMDGWWDARDLIGLITRLLQADLEARAHSGDAILAGLKARFFNLQTGRRAFEVGRLHYDLSPDLYRAMLGKRLVYSCAEWKHADNLDDAQEAKLDGIFRRIGLERGMRLLDIGCGWGEALKFAAERYGVEGVGITVSEEQAHYARDLCQGLPVRFEVMDYHRLSDRYDRVISIGMFEHVGMKNYRDYMQTVRRCLADDGVFLLSTIGGNLSARDTDPWIAKYIFPNGMLPSIQQIGAAIEGRFVMEDWQNHGVDYERTLLAWLANFNAYAAAQGERLERRFVRMWRYYLCASAASFRARKNQLWQLVLSPHGVPGGYRAPTARPRV